jgi:hypothetical protein
MPALTLVYGLLGLVPFLAPPAAGWLFPGLKDQAALVLSVYAALILSFLGGARFGFAHANPPAPALTISISMLPAIAGLLALAMPLPWVVKLPALAAALAALWIWDIRSAGLPTWYPALRTILTAGALIGLTAGWFVLT